MKFNTLVDFPEVELEGSPIYATEGGSITVSCTAMGNPLPTVQWYLKDTNRTTGQLKKKMLHLTQVDRTSNGNIYTCKAISSSEKFGELINEKSIKLVVYCKYIFRVT